MRKECSAWLQQQYNLYIELSVKENFGMPFVVLYVLGHRILSTNLEYP